MHRAINNMTILTLHTAVSKGFKPNDYSSELEAKGLVLKLDFRTKGKGDWIDCYFSCAKGGNTKLRLAAFKNEDTQKYTPKNCNTNFGDPLVRGEIFVITSTTEFGISSWAKALRIL